MPILTTNLSLTKPLHGDAGWDTVLNTNSDLLDAAISPWFYGAGAPGVVIGQTNGSFYIDTVGLGLYRRIANVWTFVVNLSGGSGALPSGAPNLVAATNSSGVTFGVAALRSLVVADIPILPQASVTGLVSALAALAPLASPVLTGNPVAPTQASTDNSTRIATTAFVVTSNLLPATAFSTTTNVPATTKHVSATGGAGGITLTLQSASMGSGWPVYLKKVDSGVGVVTITDVSGGSVFEGYTALTLANQWQWAILIWTGTQYLVFGN